MRAFAGRIRFVQTGIRTQTLWFPNRTTQQRQVTCQLIINSIPEYKQIFLQEAQYILFDPNFILMEEIKKAFPKHIFTSILLKICYCYLSSLFASLFCSSCAAFSICLLFLLVVHPRRRFHLRFLQLNQ